MEDIEAKGVRGDPNSPKTKLPMFCLGDMKGHLGKAIWKSIDCQNSGDFKNVAIAYPKSELSLKLLQPLKNSFLKLEIIIILIEIESREIEIWGNFTF